jgi:maltose alpha-D-glucosyltransferase/alpha-amylase
MVGGRDKVMLKDDPLWFRDAVIYEVHVKAFCDGNADGIGDFKGLTGKLDYLQDLGVTAVWLLPFCPSPLRDDGYDISHYKAVHPDYGSLHDFKVFLRKAHERGIRVITELVVNHTSDQHPWFQRARRAKPGSRRRDFYVWSDTLERYGETRIIFQDFESSNWSWDPVAQAYYWHRFYSHQPDLNYDNPQVRRAVFNFLDFWFQMGVDGLRLDAVPYLYEREGTNCENLPETHLFLKELRSRVDENFPNRMLLAEANQWPEDAVAYFGAGDESHMCFHFPLMPRLFMALRMEDRFPIIDILENTPEIPDTCQWALFLRNHDELTLEMVTDEERDYMYRVYAQDQQMRINLGIRRRLAPLLGNHRRRIELMNGLLFSLPGTPIVYYGDEIGMGDNIYLGDRNGVRTPMQWSPDRNAGFSRANPQRLYLPIIIDPEYHYETVNVEAQQNNPHSLLWWTKRLIGIRKRFKAFGRGTIEFLHPENKKVLVFIRRFGEECILVVANLSRFVQYVELDLSVYEGMVPVEIFGRTEFPPIGALPYLLTLGPHSFFWFALQARAVEEAAIEVTRLLARLPVLTVLKKWQAVLQGEQRAELERILPDHIVTRRWFGGKARRIKAVAMEEAIPMDDGRAIITFIRVDYTEGDAETYVLPVTYAAGEEAERVLRDNPQAVILRVHIRESGEDGVVYDAFVDQGFGEGLLEAIVRRRRRKGIGGELFATRTRPFFHLRGPLEEPLVPAILKAEQSNTSMVYGDRLILKLFRRLQPGVNPDLEIGRFLTERGFLHIPPVAGAIEYRKGRKEPYTLAILQGFVYNQGDAWAYCQDILGHFYEQALARKTELREFSVPQKHLLTLAEQETPSEVAALIGTFSEAARLLGQRTAELHVVLASDTEAPQFAQESFSKLYQRSLYQAMRSEAGKVMRSLADRLRYLPESVRPGAEEVLQRRQEIFETFGTLLQKKLDAMRIRCHGDYHLGQVLYTGKDFVIIDFEGEPARPISERRIKRSPLRDVAGMLRSFHYAAYATLFSQLHHGVAVGEDVPLLETAANLWYLWVSADFLRVYLAVAAPGGYLPKGREELQVLIDVFMLQKAVYELGYELNNRPDWVGVPIAGIRQLLGAPVG